MKFLEDKNSSFTYNFIVVILYVSGCLRALVDYFWMIYSSDYKIYLLTFFITPTYIYLLYLSIPSLGFRFLKLLFNIKLDNKKRKSVYLHSLPLICFIYPAVSLISLLFKSPPLVKISFLKYIPFFMEISFFPIGMVAVIPFLVFGYGFLFREKNKVKFHQSLICVLFSLVIIYLLFYQYLQQLAFYILNKSNVFVYIGSLTLMYLIFTSFFIEDFSSLFGKSKILKYILMVFGFISVLLISFGLILPS